MDTIWQDIRISIRFLKSKPAFAAVALITLSLGIGINTAMFGIINATMLRPLAYSEPDQLVRVRYGSSFPDMKDWIEQSTSFQSFGGYRLQNMDLTGGSVAEQVHGSLVTGKLFSVLRAQPQLGRLISPADDIANAPKIVILSHRFWANKMGLDPNVIGKKILIAGNVYSVIGVLPTDFELPELKADLYSPFTTESAEEAAARGAHTLIAVGRLKPGISIEHAQQDMDAIADRLAKLYPEDNAKMRYSLIPLHLFVVQDVRTALLILLGAVGFVLLIACSNVANLFLVRAIGREKEVALRSALGASRGRLVRQFLTESLLLSFLGGLLGLLVASWIVGLVTRIGPQGIHGLDQITMDSRVFLAAAVTSILSGLLSGLVPAFHVSQFHLESYMREGGRMAGSRQRFRNSLVICEIGLALVLLSGAGLLIRSFYLLQNVDPGFNPSHLLNAHFTLPLSTYGDIAKRTRFFDALIQRAAALPGVTSVTATTDLPFGGTPVNHNLAIEGFTFQAGHEPDIYSRGVSPQYFRTMEIRMLQGREFTSRDREDSLPVAIINQAMVTEFFNRKDPIGKRVRWARNEKNVWMTIVGVVSDVRPGLEITDFPAIYYPLAQESQWWKSWMTLTIRTSVAPSTLSGLIPKLVAEIDKDVPVESIHTMDELMTLAYADRRFQLVLLSSFAGLALVLAGIGIYGVVSYAVNQRAREIGVRMALGAKQSSIFAWVLRQGLVLGLAGVGLGLAGSILCTRLIRTFLFSVTPTDPFTLTSTALLLLMVTLASCFFPARKASGTDPIKVLHYE